MLVVSAKLAAHCCWPVVVHKRSSMPCLNEENICDPAKIFAALTTLLRIVVNYGAAVPTAGMNIPDSVS